MSLKQNLVSLIKTHGRLTHREVVQYCLDNGYKPDNGTRRLREVMDEDPTVVPDKHTGTILAYIYKPSMSDFKPPRQAIPPHTEHSPKPTQKPHHKPVNAPQKKWQKSPEFYRPIDRCCEIATFCYDKNFPIQHSQKCLTEKQEK